MSTRVAATCHCGAVALQATLPNGITGATRCTCSFCARRQAANVSALATSVVVTKGEDNLSCYTWGTRTAQHYFCKTCGIYTHHRRRADTSECGVNLGCIEGAQPWDHEPIPWTDGINHPSDSKT